MKKINLFLIILLMGLAFEIPTVHAENLPGVFTFTPGIGYYIFDRKRNVNNSDIPNIAASYNFNERWGVEGLVGFINTESKISNQPRVHGTLYLVDGLYRFQPYRCLLQPYLSAGVGVMSMKPSGNDPTNQGNINAGAGVQFFFDKHVALRGEAKDIYTMTGGKNEVMFNFGVSFLFDALYCSSCGGSA